MDQLWDKPTCYGEIGDGKHVIRMLKDVHELLDLEYATQDTQYGWKMAYSLIRNLMCVMDRKYTEDMLRVMEIIYKKHENEYSYSVDDLSEFNGFRKHIKEWSAAIFICRRLE